MDKIKVFFDSVSLSQEHGSRGIGYYTDNLLAELKKFKDIKLVDNAKKANVVHIPYFDFFFNTLRLYPGKKNIVTIYDTIPLIYPSYYPPGIKGKINFIKQKNKLSQIDAVITISETSKKDIVRFLDYPQEKIFPIHLAANSIYKKLQPGNWESEIAKKYNLPTKFVLYVGDVNYNKNLSRLAGACVLANVPLVVVGKHAAQKSTDKEHLENKSFFQFLEMFGNNPGILRLGFVESEDLVKIYNLATVYCQPSFYEGFGLPVIEAQACGIPVIASKTQALVEIAGDSCMFFDPYNEKEIVYTIKGVLNNNTLRVDLIEKGLLNTHKYSWKASAQKTLLAYKNI